MALGSMALVTGLAGIGAALGGVAWWPEGVMVTGGLLVSIGIALILAGP